MASGVSGETTVVVVQRETALVRPIDLRARTAADGDAWAVLLFGSACFLVATGFFFVWLRARMRKAAAVRVRVRRQELTAPSDSSEQIDPYPV